MLVASQMRESGATKRDILIAFDNYRISKTDQFYKRNRREDRKIDPVEALVRERATEDSDSKAEMIMYGMLRNAGIAFEFQYKIGRYRVDFLIGGILILECDGRHHAGQREYDRTRDKYLEGLGYHVVRLSWDLIAQIPDTVMEEIKALTLELLQ